MSDDPRMAEAVDAFLDEWFNTTEWRNCCRWSINRWRKRTAKSLPAALAALGQTQPHEPRRGETWSAARDEPSYPEWTPAKDALFETMAIDWTNSRRGTFAGPAAGELYEAAFPDPAQEGSP